MTYLEILPYLEGAAYIAIVIAVLGVPQLLSSYFDIRERRRNREEDRHNREEERRNREEERRNREEQRRADELRRSEHQLEAERARLQERADSERQRMEERAETERRHQETLTALMGIIATRTNGGRGTWESQNGAMREILRRLAAIEAALGLQPDPPGSSPDDDIGHTG